MAKRRASVVTARIGTRLQQARVSRGLSRDRVAKDAKMNPLRLWRIENGETRALATDVEKIARAMGVSVASLYEAAA